MKRRKRNKARRTQRQIDAINRAAAYAELPVVAKLARAGKRERARLAERIGVSPEAPV